MLRVLRTPTFQNWYDRLRDVEAKARIDVRIDRMSLGNLGDTRSVAGPIMEARIHHGPGYRIYFLRRHNQIIILLCGGDKSSQRRDIERAKQIAAEV